MKKRNDKLLMQFEEQAFTTLKNTVGILPPETGGILLGFRKDYIVRKFVFDPYGVTFGTGYDPDTNFVNKYLDYEEQNSGYKILGFLHSHPYGSTRLSGDYGNGIGDIGYLKKIFEAIPPLDRFLVPIIQSSYEGEFQIIPYVAFRGDVEHYKTAQLEVLSNKVPHPIPDVTFDSSKLSGSVDYDLMKKIHVVCVGIGGANGICEDLVRSGLGNLTAIDFDNVDETNITTQGYFASEVGKTKVDALKDRLLNVNPKLNFTGINTDFTKLSKEQIKDLAKSTDLLLMMTDNFYAQAFGNRVALKYKLPSVFAMMYEKARCSEITFMIPGITPGCHRCAVSSRYKAYENGYVNDVTSTGSTVFHTQYLNASIGLLSLAILHRNTSGFEFSNWFGNRFDRNLIQLRTHPSYSMDKGRLFERTFGGNDKVFCFDSVWQTIEEQSFPKFDQPCPDCGGIGDLNISAYFISLMQNPLFRKSDWLNTDNI